MLRLCLALAWTTSAAAFVPMAAPAAGKKTPMPTRLDVSSIAPGSKATKVEKVPNVYNVQRKRCRSLVEKPKKRQRRQYWSDERIHTLGNNGFWGAVHAAMAPLSTKLIDLLAYRGVDLRRKVRICYDCAMTPIVND